MVKIPTPRMIKISELKPYPKNVKFHPKAQLEDISKLIDWVGFKDPIVIDSDKTIWAGHGRLEVAKMKNMAEVPYVLLEDLTLDQKKAFMLMDNRVNDSPWNIENVQLLISEIPKIELEQFKLNFDDIVPPIIQEEGQAVPELPKEPKAKLGEIYRLGKHFLICADSTKYPLPGKPDMIYTDPPYGLGGYAGRSGKFEPMQNDDENIEELYKAIPECKERYIWGNWKALSFMPEPRDIIIWRKNNFGMGAGYRNQYEICLYYGSFAGSDSDLWDVAKDNVADYNHPTQKPIELARRAISNSSKQGSLVLDMFAGSGSTLLACEQLDRICYAIEINPGYIDVIIERWENLTGKHAEKIDTLSMEQE